MVTSCCLSAGVSVGPCGQSKASTGPGAIPVTVPGGRGRRKTWLPQTGQVLGISWGVTGEEWHRPCARPCGVAEETVIPCTFPASRHMSVQGNNTVKKNTTKNTIRRGRSIRLDYHQPRTVTTQSGESSSTTAGHDDRAERTALARAGDTAGRRVALSRSLHHIRLLPPAHRLHAAGHSAQRPPAHCSGCAGRRDRGLHAPAAPQGQPRATTVG